MKIMKKKNTKKIKYITFDMWAESGGSIGMFAKGVKNGTIKIIMEK